MNDPRDFPRAGNGLAIAAALATPAPRSAATPDAALIAAENEIAHLMPIWQPLFDEMDDTGEAARIYDRIWKLREFIIAAPADGLAGLAVKARLLLNIVDPDDDAIRGTMRTMLDGLARLECAAPG
jgi:hypothetical protein